MEPTPISGSKEASASNITNETMGVASLKTTKSGKSCMIKIDGFPIFEPGSINIQNIFHRTAFDLEKAYFKDPENIHLKFMEGTHRNIVVIKQNQTEYYVDRNLDPDIQNMLTKTASKQFRFLRCDLPKDFTVLKAKAIFELTFCFKSNLNFMAGAWNDYGVAFIVKDQAKYYFYFAHPDQNRAIDIRSEKIKLEKEIKISNQGSIRAISEDLLISYERVIISSFTDSSQSIYKDYINGAAATEFSM